MIASVRALSRRILALFQSRRLDLELAMELESHLELHVHDNIRAGMTIDEARRHARLALGGIAQTAERYRDRRGLPFLETLARDFKHGLRRLIHAPGFAVAAIVTIGVGIGVNVVGFAFIYAAFVRPLPYDRSDQLVLIENVTPQGRNNPSAADFQAIKKQSRTLRVVAASTSPNFDLVVAGAEPRQVRGEATTASLFALYRIAPEVGRFLTEADEKPQAAPVVVLGHALWRQAFGGDPAIVGRTISLNETPYTVVGVTRADAQPLEALFRFGAELWVPLKLTARELSDRANASVFAVGRLADDVTLAQSQAELRTIAAQQALSLPGGNRAIDLQARALQNFFWQRDDVQATALVQASAGFVLLLVSLNIVNLLIARGVVRAREIGVRVSLGASRQRIIRQLVAETMVVFIVGGIAAVGVAAVCLRLLLASWAFPLPGFIKVRVDWVALAFAFGLTAIVGVFSALAPALLTSQVRPGESLQEGGRSVTRSGRRRRLAAVLVSTEIALAFVLLTGTALMLRSLARLSTSDPGFDTANLVTFRLSLPESRYPRVDQMTAFVDRVDAALMNTTGITSTGWASLPPLFPFQSFGLDISIEGLEYNPLSPPHVELRVISPGYFAALHGSVLEGREFTEFDDASAPPLAIVNQSLASHFWPNQSALGRRVRIGGPTSPRPWMTVIGVVGDIHQLSRSTPPAAEMYIPYRRSPRRDVFLLVRTASAPERVIPKLKQAIWAVDRDLPASQVRTMAQATTEDVFPQQMMSNVFGVFSLFALLLAALGTYAIVSHAVTERRRELAIRMAFGATRRDLVRLVFRQMTIAIAAGLVIGVALSLGLRQAMQGFLFGISGFSAIAILLATATLIACSAMAIYLPAQRAAKVHPMVTLRQE